MVVGGGANGHDRAMVVMVSIDWDMMIRGQTMVMRMMV